MKRGRYCSDCGSPYEGNPCWWPRPWTEHPPCVCRQFDRAETARVWRKLAAWAAGAVLIVGTILLAWFA